MALAAVLVSLLAPASARPVGAVDLLGTTAPPLPAVATSGDLYQLTKPSWIIGHDRGQSARITYNGVTTTYWSFGDAASRNPSNPSNPYLARGTVARTADTNLADNITTSSWIYDKKATNPDRVGQAVSITAAQKTLCPGCNTWGGMIVADQAHNQVFMLYHAFDAKDDRGYGIAVRDATNPANEFVSKNIVGRPTGEFLFSNPDPRDQPSEANDPPTVWDGYGTGAMLHNGYLYAYACRGEVGPQGSCKLARVDTSTPSNVYDRSKWRFWNPYPADTSCGTGWTSSSGCAAPVIARGGGSISDGNGGMSVSWNPSLGRFVQIYASGGNVMYRVADQPEGAWSEPGLAFRGKEAGAEMYAAYPHPEYSTADPLTQYVSYYTSDGVEGNDRYHRMAKIVFSATQLAEHKRWATAEAYFAHSSTLRINAYGPTTYASTSTGPVDTTGAGDNQGTIFDDNTGKVGTTVTVRIDNQNATSTASAAGIVFRNTVDGVHHIGTYAGNDYSPEGRGWVILAKQATSTGSIVLRGDTDGDQDLDASALTVPYSGNAVYLRLTRLDEDTYEGSWSSTGTEGSFTSIGTVDVPGAYTLQDTGIFSTGTASAPNLATFSGLVTDVPCPCPL